VLALALLLQAAAPATSPWTPRTRQDATTGASSVSIGAVSRDHNARLAVVCNNGGDPVVSVQYITRTALGATDDRPVRVTVDGSPAIEGTWEFPGNGTYTRDSALVTQLTLALATARTIQIHTTDLANNPIDATFDGPATDAGVKQVLSACGYQFGVVPKPKPQASPAANAPHL
jgi:hypothetical protein